MRSIGGVMWRIEEMAPVAIITLSMLACFAYIRAKVTVDEKTGCWNWGTALAQLGKEV